MIKFKTYLTEELLNEYLTDSQREKYSKIKMTPQAREATDHFFGKDKDDVREDLKGYDEENKSEVHKKVEEHIGSNIDVDNYKKGISKDKHGRDVRIGKLIKDEKLRNDFANDSARAGVKSSHGHYATIVRGTEVAGQTNSAPDEQHPRGHSWGDESCKNVDTGSNKRYLTHEVKHGSVVVRVHDNSDKEIYRATLHPHHNDAGHTAYAVDSEYGVKHSNFTEHAKDVAKRLSGSHKGGSLNYIKNSKVYNDSGKTNIIHPNVTKEDLDRVQMSKDVINHPNATKEHLDRGIRDEDAAVREAVVSHPNASKEHLDAGIKDVNSRVRKAVVRHPNATKEHLDTGLKDKDVFIRHAAIIHPNATSEHLDAGMKDKNTIIKLSVLGHKNVTKEHVDAGMKDKDPTVRASAVRNSLATKEHIDLGIKDKDPMVRRYALSNQNVTR